ncbi:MAG: hypothetical protein QM831_35080 [Kofleriaceae bacterium]
MTTRLAALIVIVACGGQDVNPLLPRADAPPDIASACELASHRCSRCHSLDRILRARITEPREWQGYVHKMRLMPSSGIPPEEEPTITSCLVYRTRGIEGQP